MHRFEFVVYLCCKHPHMIDLPTHIDPDLPYTDLVYLSGGSFDLSNRYKRTLPDFAIGKYPITQELWEKTMGILQDLKTHIGQWSKSHGTMRRSFY
jgi:hypothetical protein